MQHHKFNYSDIDELAEQARDNNIALNYSKNTDVLKQSVKVQGRTIPNRLAVHPMEGCDGNPDGSPDELTIRRYRRFAAGGAGLLWFEAVAVVPEGRANPRQLWITEKNLDTFKDLFDMIMREASDKNGYTPLVIMQLTHSGRFSVPREGHEPVIAYHNPYLNQKFDIPSDHPVITDVELEALEEKYVKAAKLAKRAGFHGVDIKGCHRYLISELFSAYGRSGKYGGNFENRARFMLNVTDRIKKELGDGFIVAARLNIYDGIPYPYGWGADKTDFMKLSLEEPIKLIDLLYEKGVRLVNVTMGTPYYNPHVNRPYDAGGYLPEESPLEGVARLINGTGEVQNKFPDIAVVGTGYTWLRHLAPNVAAGVIENGMAKLIGFGRQAFAYPDYAKDILEKREMDRKKCCITCGKCTELMRAKTVSGCVVRDAEVYGAIYKEKVMGG